MINPNEVETALEALKKEQQEDVEKGFTSRELAKHLGKNIYTVRRMLREAQEQGMCTCLGLHPRKAIDGLMRPVPIYKWKKNK